MCHDMLRHIDTLRNTDGFCVKMSDILDIYDMSTNDIYINNHNPSTNMGL